MSPTGGKASIAMAAGDLLIINTPGAGGCGPPPCAQAAPKPVAAAGASGTESTQHPGPAGCGAPDGMFNAGSSGGFEQAGEGGSQGGAVRGRDDDDQLQRALQAKRQKVGPGDGEGRRVVLKGSVQEYVGAQEGA